MSDTSAVQASAWRWPLAFVAAVLAAVYVYRFTADKVAEEARDWRERAIETTARGLSAGESLPERFRQGTITKTFLASMPDVAPSHGDVLELATAKSVETFRVEDRKTVAWNMIDLGSTVSEIRVPVTYRYHIRLSDDWHLTTSGNTCLVFAPPLRPSQPPAIHTDGLLKRSKNGWARFNKGRQLEELERSLTPRLTIIAADDAHLALVREECRDAVAAFVRRWLLHEDQWREDRFSSVRVLFPGEVGEFAEAPPALTVASPTQ